MQFGTGFRFIQSVSDNADMSEQRSIYEVHNLLILFRRLNQN